MARGRMISRTLGSSRKYADLHARLAELAEFAQSLYPLLVSCSDDFGRQSGDAFTVKHAVFPSSPRHEPEFAAALAAMHNAQLIRWYGAGGQEVIQILDFDEHQPGLSRRTKSRFPDPPVKFTEIPEIHASRARAELNGTEQNGTERKGTEQDQNKPPHDARRDTRPVEKSDETPDGATADRNAPTVRDREDGVRGGADDHRRGMEGANEGEAGHPGMGLPLRGDVGERPERRRASGDADTGATADAGESPASPTPTGVGTPVANGGADAVSPGRVVLQATMSELTAKHAQAHNRRERRRMGRSPESAAPSTLTAVRGGEPHARADRDVEAEPAASRGHASPHGAGLGAAAAGARR